MKGYSAFLLVTALMCPPCLSARRIPLVSAATPEATTAANLPAAIERLRNVQDFKARATYDVALPMATDDVRYIIDLAAGINPADTLEGYSYLIDWTLPRAETEAKGFLAYFNGHHYRYRDHRLQEYHYQWDSIPFRTESPVHSSGQFTDLLPRGIARELSRMQTDTSFVVRFIPDTTYAGTGAAAVKATQTIKGVNSRNFLLILDSKTGLPTHISNEYNPSTLSEQTVDVSYTYPSGNPELTAVSSEEQLMSLYPEVFEKYRESNYRIEHLASLPMPTFSLPTTTGERYTHTKGTPFKAPTLLAIIDPAVETAGQTIDAIRKAVAMMPRQIDILFAFTTSNTDLVEEIAGNPEDGETHLISAKTLARDCGTGVFPTIILIDTKGIVANVILGVNNSLTQDVIQLLALVG